jgi:hypothetical protein
MLPTRMPSSAKRPSSAAAVSFGAIEQQRHVVTRLTLVEQGATWLLSLHRAQVQ